MSEPNWLPKLRRAARANGIPFTEAVTLAQILHDDDCARLNNEGVCNCDPDVQLTSTRIEDLDGRDR